VGGQIWWEGSQKKVAGCGRVIARSENTNPRVNNNHLGVEERYRSQRPVDLTKWERQRRNKNGERKDGKGTQSMGEEVEKKTCIRKSREERQRSCTQHETGKDASRQRKKDPSAFGVKRLKKRKGRCSSIRARRPPVKKDSTERHGRRRESKKGDGKSAG